MDSAAVSGWFPPSAHFLEGVLSTPWLLSVLCTPESQESGAAEALALCLVSCCQMPLGVKTVEYFLKLATAAVPRGIFCDLGRGSIKR